MRSALFVSMIALAGAVLPGVARAQGTAPERKVPPSVLVEVELLESRFEQVLAADCDRGRCTSTGCSYLEHAVADRPPQRSLPGLGGDPGPSDEAQAWLTRARCGFAHEPNLAAEDVDALTSRLRAKVSSGWMSVSVSARELEPLPDYVRTEPVPEAPPEADKPVLPPPPEWGLALASRELWTALLPHFGWMAGMVLATLAGATLIWSWRKLGATSIEDQMLLAEIAAGGGAAAAPEAPKAEPDDEAAFVAREDASWRARIAALDPAEPDPELQALVRELLRAGDLPLLATAVLRYPTLPAAFPEGGEVAAAKLELADFLKTADPAALQADADFFRTLGRHALAASVASQDDARIVRSLREDFGAAGLAGLVGRLPARPAGLLFALAPAEEQHEAIRLLDPARVAEMAGALLRSNRMDPSETATLFGLLEAVRAGEPLPAVPAVEVTDRGAAFDAASALSVLLEAVNPTRRAALFGEALQRFGGSLPAWHRGVLVSDLLFALPDEARTDLLLEVEVEPLAAWLSTLDRDARDRLLAGAPSSLRSSVLASSTFPSRARQLALAERGRRDLARALQGQLARAGLSFERAVHPEGAAP